MAEESNLLQSRASVARLAHNQEVVGSIPTSAPNFVGALKLPDTLERKHCHSLNQCLGWIQVLPAGYGTDRCVASIHGPTNFCSGAKSASDG